MLDHRHDSYWLGSVVADKRERLWGCFLSTMEQIESSLAA
jgi:hypothetical protein